MSTDKARIRGFTLIELMIVVAILGVLSVLAVTGYRKYVYAGRNAEAQQFLGGIRAAQETYFQAFGVYCGSEDWEVWPAAIPVDMKLDWEPVGNDTWQQLGVKSPGLVWFQYQIQAGRGQPFGEVPPNPPFNRQDRPWFWAQARGNFNGDAILSTFEVTSEKGEVFIENENE